MITHNEKKDSCYLESRLNRLEWQAKEHADEIREVKKTASALSEALQDISQCLQQIKFTAFGAMTMLLLSTFGVLDTMALILSK
jgi:predicted  nucleic acid-binding Zn-ribbon protein